MLDRGEHRGTGIVDDVIDLSEFGDCLVGEGEDLFARGDIEFRALPDLAQAPARSPNRRR
jgi:hypothetical protein